MIGSIASNKPTFMLIGSGSGTELAGLSGLFAVIGSPKAFTSTDITTVKEITWQSDYTPVEMSGLSLHEFILSVGSVDGAATNYVNFGTPVTFDGTNELRLEITWQIF